MEKEIDLSNKDILNRTARVLILRILKILKTDLENSIKINIIRGLFKEYGFYIWEGDEDK